MGSNSIKVYGYIRVSTEGQVKQGYSLAEQCAEIEKFCGYKSYKLLQKISIFYLVFLMLQERGM